MRLERIILKSFGCFDRRDFDLSDGVNLIFGPNFSGKSTLVNAIFFALTGKPIVPKGGFACNGTIWCIQRHRWDQFPQWRAELSTVPIDAGRGATSPERGK